MTNIAIKLETANGVLSVPVRKIESDFGIDLSKVSSENLTRIFMYGVTQITNDCHASIKAEEANAAELVRAAIDKRWDAIYSGEWRGRAAAGESASPIEREALSMAREAVRLAWSEARKANGKLPVWGKLDEEKKANAADSYLDKNRAALMEQAAERVAAKKDAAKAVDLSALGL